MNNTIIKELNTFDIKTVSGGKGGCCPDPSPRPICRPCPKGIDPQKAWKLTNELRDRNKKIKKQP